MRCAEALLRFAVWGVSVADVLTFSHDLFPYWNDTQDKKVLDKSIFDYYTFVCTARRRSYVGVKQGDRS